MPTEFLGAEEINAADRSYQGSRFAQVRDAVFANPYQKVWGRKDEPPLPVYQVSLRNFLRGILSCRRPHTFTQATARAVDSGADLRWGADGQGFRRLLHPNGICLTGSWKITGQSEYSGYFSQGSQALVIARYSTCCSDTRRGHVRSLSLVGKLYPTADPEHREPLRTANFITQQDIGGDSSDYINDAVTLNAPNTTAWRRGLGLPVLLITGLVFMRVDKQPSIRQLYQIAELGKPIGMPIGAPEFMRLRVASDQPRISGERLDFRDEIMAQIFDKGDPVPKRTLTFDIDVTDEGSTNGPLIFQRRTFKNWKCIGKLVFDNAVISYNGDFVIHFNHPTWREDRNDPSTATRVNGTKL